MYYVKEMSFSLYVPVESHVAGRKGVQLALLLGQGNRHKSLIPWPQVTSHTPCCSKKRNQSYLQSPQVQWCPCEGFFEEEPRRIFVRALIVEPAPGPAWHPGWWPEDTPCSSPTGLPRPQAPGSGQKQKQPCNTSSLYPFVAHLHSNIFT